MLRDLCQADDGGWLQDVALLEGMVAEKLIAAATEIAAEGWIWVEVATDFAYGHTFGLRALVGEPEMATQEEEEAREALQTERDELEAAHASFDELPHDVDERIGQIEEALETFAARPMIFAADEIAHAGTFVSLAANGRLRIERGFVRPQDEAPGETEAGDEAGAIEEQGDGSGERIQTSAQGGTVAIEGSASEDGGMASRR